MDAAEILTAVTDLVTANPIIAAAMGAGAVLFLFGTFIAKAKRLGR